MKTVGKAQDRGGAVAARGRAFTLIEMLLVLIIIVLLAALALPHMKGHTEAAAINAAMGQVMADLSYARQRAMAQRSTVAVVFLTDAVFNQQQVPLANADAEERVAIRRLQAGAFTHYALFQFRHVGEQPGRGSRGYITEWKALPSKTFFFFATNAAFNPYTLANMPIDKFPFPFTRSWDRQPNPIEPKLPYIAFDSEGRSIALHPSLNGSALDFRDAALSIARGATFHGRDPQSDAINTFEIQEIPPYNSTNNVIAIDFLTGRAKRVQTEVQ